LAIAQSIVHEPELLLLDEPASGLDPEARHELSSLFLELRDQGMTLVVSSHILSELEDYCTDMIIVRDGKIVEHKSLQAQEVKIANIIVKAGDDPGELLALLESRDDISNLSRQNDEVRFEFSMDKERQQQLLKSLIEQNIPVYGFMAETQNMQDAYLQRIKKHEQGGDDA